MTSLVVLPTVHSERETQFENSPSAAAHKFAVSYYDLGWYFLFLGTMIAISIMLVNFERSGCR